MLSPFTSRFSGPGVLVRTGVPELVGTGVDVSLVGTGVDVVLVPAIDVLVGSGVLVLVPAIDVLVGSGVLVLVPAIDVLVGSGVLVLVHSIDVLGGRGVHAVAPALDHVPAAQDVHAVAPALDHVPAAQDGHSAIFEHLVHSTTLFGLYQHLSHGATPLVARYVPLSHGVQDVTPLPLVVPASQNPQFQAPA